MTILEAIILGIVQGLTEFIPVSSTAHLTMAGQMLGLIDPAHPERWTAFIATIQLGTLAAVFVYFYRDIASMAKAFFTEVVQPWRTPPSQWTHNARLSVLVILGTIPIVTVGLALKKVIEGSFTKDLHVIAGGLIVVGLLLWWSERKASFARNIEAITWRDALIIGFAQVMALIPGASRSGSTIMAGLFRGLNREDAARFSFLLSIPAISGAGVLEFVGELKHISFHEGGIQLIVATVAALVSGYYSIAFLLKFLRTRSVNIFVFYRLAVAAVILLTACSPTTQDVAVQEIVETKGVKQVEETPTATSPDNAQITQTVRVKTSAGNFTIGLYGQDAPLTVKNFTSLVAKKYYDRILIHRVVPGFVIQMGDPKTRDAGARAEWGKGGATASGSPLPEEIDPLTTAMRVGYQPGVVAMARRSESGSGTSQFFICLESAAVLPPQYTIFGRVTEGMDVVRTISKVDVVPGPLGEIDAFPRKPILVRSIRLN